MPTSGFENSADPGDSHSINVSVFKPDGVSSLWSWFRKKDKTSLPNSMFEQSNNFKLKLNADDLKKLKAKGIDLKQFQNKVEKTTPVMYNNNIFVIPKHHLTSKETKCLNLMPNLTKPKSPLNNKIYERVVVTRSTSSVKTKHNIVNTNIKYVQAIKSQRSIANSVCSVKPSFRVGVKSNSNFNSHVKTIHKNILLKSVPTNILRSNTQKKVFIPIYVGRKKPEINIERHDDNKCDNSNADVIPMLIKRIKSMEEQLSDIENTTKKINEAVSHQNIAKSTSLTNAKNKHKENKLHSKPKSIASHKIYSKNVHTNKKPNHQKKLKNTGYPMFNYHYYSKAQEPFFNTYKIGNGATPNNLNMFGISQQVNSKLKTSKSSSINVIPTNNVNNSEKGYDAILKILKAVTEANQLKSSQEFKNDEYDARKINSLKEPIETGPKIHFGSKPTFDWKHKSVSSSSESKLLDHKRGAKNEITLGIKKYNYIPVNEKQNIICDKGILDKSQNILGVENVENVDLTRETSKELKEEVFSASHTGSESNSLKKIYSDKNVGTEEPLKFKVISLNKSSSIDKTFFKNEAIQTSDTEVSEKSSVMGELSISDTSNICLKQLTDDDILPAKECQGLTSSSTVAEDMCKLEIKENNNSEQIIFPENIKVDRLTNLVSSEPKVNITILVQDTIKEQVKMSSNIVTGPQEFINSFTNRDIITRGAGDMVENGELNAGNNQVRLDQTELNNSCLNAACTVRSQNMLNTRMHFKATDESQGVKHVGSGNTKDGNCFDFKDQNGYLNLEKRKIYEERLLGIRENDKESKEFTNRNQVISCMDLTCSSDLILLKNENYTTSNYQDLNFASGKQTITSNHKLSPNPDQSICKKRGPWSLENLDTRNTEDENLVNNPFIKSSLSECQTYKNKNEVGLKSSFVTIVENEPNKTNGPVEIDEPVLTARVGHDQKRRSCRYGTTIFNDLFLEESPKELMLPSEVTLIDQRSEKGDNAKVQANVLDTKLLTECDYEVSELKYTNTEVLEDDNNTESNNNNNSVNKFLFQSVQSSVSVQTDWSLVGITVDHFKSNAFFKSVDTNTVSIQTDEMLKPDEQRTMFPTLCQSCMNNLQPDPYLNSTTRIDKSLNIAEENINFVNEIHKDDTMELKMSSVLISLEDVNKPENNNEFQGCDINRSNIQIIDKKIDYSLEQSLALLELQQDTNFERNEDTFHHCSIPCFPSLSDDIIISRFNEPSGNKNVRVIPEDLPSNITTELSKIFKLDGEGITPNLNLIDDSPIDRNLESGDTNKEDNSIQTVSIQAGLILPQINSQTDIDKKLYLIKELKEGKLVRKYHKPASQRDRHCHSIDSTQKATNESVLGFHNIENESLRSNSIFTNITDSNSSANVNRQTRLW